MTGRYVDDIILASKVCCSRCLKRLVWQVYGSTVKFDYTEPTQLTMSTLMVPYLEAVLFFSLKGATSWVIHKNEAYGFSGRISDLAKQSLPPYLGAFPPTLLKQHRAELRGRLKRWQQLRVCDLNWLVLICSDVLLLLRLGYNGQHIQRIWYDILPPSQQLEIS